MSDEQFEFVMAIDKYKRKNARPFPTWTEVLDVIKALGYRDLFLNFGMDKKAQRVIKIRIEAS